MTDGGLPPTAFFVLGVLLGVSSPPTDTIDFQRVSLPGGGACFTWNLVGGNVKL